MKKLVLTVAAVFAFGFANAQEKKEGSGAGFGKGDVFVSGIFTISSEKQGEDKSNSFGIEPKVGFFVTDNIAIGGKLGYMSDKSESAGVDTNDESTFTVGAFGRYYFTPSNDFSVFANLGLDYNSITDNLTDPEFKVNGFDIALSPGFNYFVSDNFALEASFGRLGYSSTKADVDGAEAANEFGLELDLRSISFGLNYKF